MRKANALAQPPTLPKGMTMEHREYETILFREEGPVGILTLTRPDDGNIPGMSVSGQQ